MHCLSQTVWHWQLLSECSHVDLWLVHLSYETSFCVCHAVFLYMYLHPPAKLVKKSQNYLTSTSASATFSTLSLTFCCPPDRPDAVFPFQLIKFIKLLFKPNQRTPSLLNWTVFVWSRKFVLVTGWYIKNIGSIFDIAYRRIAILVFAQILLIKVNLQAGKC